MSGWAIEEVSGVDKLYVIFYNGTMAGQALDTGNELSFKGSGFKNPTEEELKTLYKKVKK
jgi:hypothetical protein